MKYKWLNKKENSSIICFFNGWGFDECVVKHLGYEQHDVVMFYDYNSLDCDFDFSLLKSYKERYLISWSMGVMIATKFVFEIGNINTSVAINGTLEPISVTNGINPKIYDLTIRGFSERGRDKFVNNMFSTPLNFRLENSRTLDSQKSELISIKEYHANPVFKYDKVFISVDDKIIPTKNQEHYWNKKANTNGGHCIFFDYKNWGELL